MGLKRDGVSHSVVCHGIEKAEEKKLRNMNSDPASSLCDLGKYKKPLRGYFFKVEY